MKLISYAYQGQRAVGILEEAKGRVIPLADYTDMNDLIDRSTMEALQAAQAAAANCLPLAQVQLLAPIPQPKQDLICLGINYYAHSQECPEEFDKERAEMQTEPIYFSKRVNEAVAPGGAIEGHFDICSSLDYECELAVIIGREAKNVAEAEAKDYIFGYTIVNDVSARSLQTAHKQWYFGKSLDGITPMGPCILTADQVEFPPKLNISCRVNGELRQNSNTGLLINGIAKVISQLSQGITLQPGTVIITGTPGGVGMGMSPQVWLQAGDVVTCEIEKIGVLENTVQG